MNKMVEVILCIICFIAGGVSGFAVAAVIIGILMDDK